MHPLLIKSSTFFIYKEVHTLKGNIQMHKNPDSSHDKFIYYYTYLEGEGRTRSYPLQYVTAWNNSNQKKLICNGY